MENSKLNKTEQKEIGEYTIREWTESCRKHLNNDGCDACKFCCLCDVVQEDWQNKEGNDCFLPIVLSDSILDETILSE